MSRLDYWRIAPDGMKVLMSLGTYIHNCGLDTSLLELVFLRVSQINGCAFCVDMHAKILRDVSVGETKQTHLAVWWESPAFTERETAALAWAEAVTKVAETRVPDDVYERARAQFSEKELIDLTFAIITINAHNRLGIAFRREPSK